MPCSRSPGGVSAPGGGLVSARGGGLLWRGVCYQGGCLLWGWVCLLWGSAPRGMSALGGVPGRGWPSGSKWSGLVVFWFGVFWFGGLLVESGLLI